MKTFLPVDLAGRGIGVQNLADPIRVYPAKPEDSLSQLAVVMLALSGQLERTYAVERAAHTTGSPDNGAIGTRTEERSLGQGNEGKGQNKNGCPEQGTRMPLLILILRRERWNLAGWAPVALLGLLEVTQEGAHGAEVGWIFRQGHQTIHHAGELDVSVVAVGGEQFKRFLGTDSEPPHKNAFGFRNSPV